MIANIYLNLGCIFFGALLGALAIAMVTVSKCKNCYLKEFATQDSDEILREYIAEHCIKKADQ